MHDTIMEYSSETYMTQPLQQFYLPIYLTHGETGECKGHDQATAPECSDLQNHCVAGALKLKIAALSDIPVPKQRYKYAPHPSTGLSQAQALPRGTRQVGIFEHI